jgi:hypothetical protein
MSYLNRLLLLLLIVGVQALTSSSGLAATLPTAELTLHNGTLKNMRISHTFTFCG